MAKFFVCQSSSCRGLQSDKLVRDLEELCALSGCHAASSGCLDLCGKGPNVKVQTAKDVTVVEGVKTFKAVRSLLEKNGAKPRKVDLQVAEMKFEARRAKGEERLAKVEKGFKAIDSSKEPKLSSTLLALRAEERLNGKDDAFAALQDAEKAIELWSGFGPAHLSAALAMLRLGRVDQAREQFEMSQDSGHSLNKEHMRMVMKLLAEAKEAEAKEAKEAEAKKVAEAKVEPKRQEKAKEANVKKAPKKLKEVKDEKKKDVESERPKEVAKEGKKDKKTEKTPNMEEVKVDKDADAMTTAAEVLSCGFSCVEGELTESGLVAPGPAVAAAGLGWRGQRRIVSL